MTNTENLIAFARWAINESFMRGDVDGCDLHQKAFELGLLVKVPFDPEKHTGEGSEFCEPGDDWYVPAPFLREG